MCQEPVGNEAFVASCSHQFCRPCVVDHFSKIMRNHTQEANPKLETVVSGSQCPIARYYPNMVYWIMCRFLCRSNVFFPGQQNTISVVMHLIYKYYCAPSFKVCRHIDSRIHCSHRRSCPLKNQNVSWEGLINIPSSLWSSQLLFSFFLFQVCDLFGSQMKTLLIDIYYCYAICRVELCWMARRKAMIIKFHFFLDFVLWLVARRSFGGLSWWILWGPRRCGCMKDGRRQSINDYLHH